jgi:MFS transporter, DHA1 family, inner membrane transport protein
VAKINAARAAPRGFVSAILTLGLGGLFVGTGEFASMSLLPGMAASTDVSIPGAGAYISAYAIGVMVGAPLIAVGAARWPRRRLLLALMLLFALGYVGSAMATSYHALVVARFVSGLPHGAYYGVASVVATALAGEGKRAQAVGYVMLGLAAANVIGVPAATGLGQWLGWQAAFVAVAAGAVLTLIMMLRYIPTMPGDGSPMKELSGLKNPLLWLTLGVASIGFGGMFAVYSYITPTLTKVTGFEESTVPLVLCVWGLGMVVGNLVGGKFADKALVPTIFGFLLWNAVFLGAFSIFASSKTVTTLVLFLVGTGFALVPALQTRLMNVAGEAQTLAAALNHSAFNLSNAIGAVLGGAAISHNLGWAATGWVGGGLALFGMALMAITVSGRWKT